MMSVPQAGFRSRVRHSFVTHPLFFLLLIAVPVVEVLAAVRGGPGPSLAIVRNPFAAIAAASVFCRYLIHDRAGRTRKWIVYLSPLTWAIPLAIEGRIGPLLWLDMMFGLGVLGAIGFLIAARAAPNPEVKSRYTGQLMNALVLPLAASMVSYGLWSTYRINPVYDTRIYAFEEILGPRFSLLGVKSFRWLAPLSALATICYALLALATTIVAAVQGSQRRETDFLSAFVAAGICGFALYFVCPVVGPLTAFAPVYPKALPTLIPDAPLMHAALGAPRNGMPSLHTIWALLIWFNARPLALRWRVALRIFVVMTLWAVMGLADTHWLMDVIVAVPLAAAVQVLLISSRRETASRKWTTAIVCVALVAVWLVAFRSGTWILQLPRLVAWVAVVATVWWPLSRLSPPSGEPDPVQFAGTTALNEIRTQPAGTQDG